MNSRRFSFIVNVIYWCIIGALFYVAFKHLLPLLLPFVIAFGCAALLQRPIKLLSERYSRLPRKAVAAAVILVSLATIGTAAVLLIGALIEEISDFVTDIPAMLSQLAASITAEQSPIREFIAGLPPALAGHAAELYDRLTADIPGLLLSAADGLSGLLIESFGAIGSFAMRLPSVIIAVLIAVITVFFVGVDYQGARSAIAEITPQRMKERLRYVNHCCADTVGCLLRTYAFLMLLTFTELAVGFALFNLMGAGIPYAVPLALLTALVDILPVLGVGTVLIPWAVFDLCTGNISRGIMLLVLYAVIVVIRNFLEPKLVGQRFGLHPAVTLAAIYAGGKLFGFIGVLLVPLTIIVAKRLKDSGVFASAAADTGDR